MSVVAKMKVENIELEIGRAGLVGKAITPLLTICVPTFNRRECLERLLKSLILAKSEFLEEMDIYVSDNCSTDGTDQLLQSYEGRLKFRRRRNEKNYGGTSNIISVAAGVVSGWGVLVGDDDEIDMDGLRELISVLRTADPSTWFLVDALSLKGQRLYFNNKNYNGATFSGSSFWRKVLRSGLTPFGFMGVHVFPSISKAVILRLNIDYVRPWPHTAAMVVTTSDSNMKYRFLDLGLVRQAAGDECLFWEAGDTARIRLERVRILARMERSGILFGSFIKIQMLRELYCPTVLKSMFAWKLCEGEDFNADALRTYMRTYAEFGMLSFLVLPHLVALLFCIVSPRSAFELLMGLVGKGGAREEYLELKKEMGRFNGVERGL